MNPLVKVAVVYALEFLISHEPTFAAHKSAEVQKLGADVANAAKALLPILQAL